MDLAIPADYRVKLKETETKDKYLDLAREFQKTVEHERGGYINCNWCSWYSYQRIGNRARGLRNKRMGGDNPYSISEKKRLGDLRRLIVTQTPVTANQLTLM